MLIKKKLLYFIKKKNKFIQANIYIYKIINIAPHSYLIRINSNYNEILNFHISLKSKYLYLFSMYIIYNKLKKITNLFFFKFHILKIKKTKFTILRAPCNHKNSKEQYIINTYKTNIKIKSTFLYNRFFFNYLLLDKENKKTSGIKCISHNIKLNEK
jgi:hypothetical protein